MSNQQQQQRPMSTVNHFTPSEGPMINKIRDFPQTKVDSAAGFTNDPRRQTLIQKNLSGNGVAIFGGQIIPAMQQSVVGIQAQQITPVNANNNMNNNRKTMMVKPSSPSVIVPLRESNLNQLNNANNAAATKARSNSSPAPAASVSGETFIAPVDMNAAMVQFDQAKKDAQRLVRVKKSKPSRLVNAMADLTVVLLTRAMLAGAHDKIELRIYKKPANLGNGNWAVAEFRDVKTKADKKAVKKSGPSSAAPQDASSEAEFVIITSGELLADAEKDTVENWRQFAGVVSSLSMWWRYTMALHKRVGWKVNLDRHILNVVDSRLLGYVTVSISNFV